MYYAPHKFVLPSGLESVGGLLWNAVFYGVLFWYFDAILQGNHGIPRKWCVDVHSVSEGQLKLILLQVFLCLPILLV